MTKSIGKTPTVPAKRRKKRFSADDLELLLLSIPTTVWYLLFAYLPIFGVIIAFKNYKPALGNNFMESLMLSPWAGLNNLKFLFMTPDAVTFIRNTLLYNAAFITIAIFVPTTLAILLTQMHSARMAKITQTAMFLPNFLSWLIIGYFVFAFLSPNRGFVNNTLSSMGMQTVDWYMEPKYWPFIIVFMNTWRGMGYGTVIYLAAIAGIDKEMYEAALIDGASRWQQTLYITIPFLRPVVTILFILNVGNIFRSDFGLFFQVPRDSGPLADVMMTIDVYVYKALMRLNNIPFASSAALLQSVVGLFTVLGANFVVSKIDPDSAMF